MEHLYTFTPAEQKTRKLWLIASFIALAFLPLLGVLTIATNITEIAYSTFSSLAGLYLLFYCAYKKYGTRYLLFCLILGPFVALSRITTVLGYFLAHSPDSLLVMIPLVDLAIYVWWYRLTLKLRRINSRVRAQRLQAPSPNL